LGSVLHGCARTTADAPLGPKVARSTVLTPTEEAIVVAFRQKTLPPLNDLAAAGTYQYLAKVAVRRTGG
jgi:hypothetical protein